MNKCFSMLLAFYICACGRSSSNNQLLGVEDAQSIMVREDGRYNVICKDGSFEIATSSQIQNNSVCPNNPTNPINWLAIQLRPDSNYDVLCKDQTWEIATPEDIVENRVCSAGSNAYTVYVATNSLYTNNAGGLSISRNGGLTFTNYTNGLPGSTALKSYGLTDTFVSANGTIYTASQDFDGRSGGVSVSRNGGISFENFNQTNGLGSNTVNSVFSTISGSIYAGTHGGLSISKNGNAPFTNRKKADGLGSDYVTAVVANGDSIYAGTSNGLAISTDGGASFINRTTYHGLGSNNVLSVIISHFGKIMVGTLNGLSTSSDGGKSFVNDLEGNHINDIFISRSNTIYAATGGNGLLVSRNGGQTFSKYTSSAHGLGSDNVNSVFADGNSIFVGTNNGLSISRDGGNHFVTRTEKDGLGHRYVMGVYVVRN